jgi:hypothetical protein
MKSGIFLPALVEKMYGTGSYGTRLNSNSIGLKIPLIAAPEW